MARSGVTTSCAAARLACAVNLEIEIYLWNGAEPVLIEGASGQPQK